MLKNKSRLLHSKIYYFSDQFKSILTDSKEIKNVLLIKNIEKTEKDRKRLPMSFDVLTNQNVYYYI